MLIILSLQGGILTVLGCRVIFSELEPAGEKEKLASNGSIASNGSVTANGHVAHSYGKEKQEVLLNGNAS